MPRHKIDRNVALARKLRRAMSLPEVMLWQLLRRAPDGVRFRRQHPLGVYALDFYCAAAKVCIEIDGMAHDISERAARDGERDAWLRGQGIEVVRVAASEVLKSPEAVAEAVIHCCKR